MELTLIFALVLGLTFLLFDYLQYGDPFRSYNKALAWLPAGFRRRIALKPTLDLLKASWKASWKETRLFETAMPWLFVLGGAQNMVSAYQIAWDSKMPMYLAWIGLFVAIFWLPLCCMICFMAVNDSMKLWKSAANEVLEDYQRHVWEQHQALLKAQMESKPSKGLYPNH